MADQALHDEVAQRLRTAKQRYSTGRRLLVCVLMDADGPITIPEIVHADSRLAQSSVYRNLVVLENTGVVDRIVTTHEFARYELTEDLTEHHHHHLICTSCGDVSDFSLSPEIERDLELEFTRAAGSSSFALQAHRTDLLGVCGPCQE